MPAPTASPKPNHDFPLVTSRPNLGLTRNQWLGIAALVMLAAALRIYRIDHESGWSSEIISVYASMLPPGNVPDWLIKDVKNPLDTPFYYWLVHGWFQVVGSGVLQARVLAACFGILCIPAIFLLAENLLGKRVALIAALILTVSEFGVSYSQEARPLTQLAFFLLTTVYLFVRALKERRKWLWYASVVSGALMIFTHYYGLFVLLILWLFAIIYRRKYPIPWKWWALSVLTMAILIGAWTVTVVQNHPLTRQQLFKADNAALAGRVGWQHLGAVLGWFNSVKWFGINSASPLWLLAAGMLLFAVPAIWGAYRSWSGTGAGAGVSQQREAVILLGALSVFPLIAGIYLATFGLNKYIEFANDIRFLTLSAAPYYILAAAGLAAIPSVWGQRIGIALVVMFSAASLRAVYFIPEKADYRSAVGYMTAAYQPEDCILFYPLDREGSLPQGMLFRHLPGPPRFWHIYSPGLPDIRITRLEKMTTGKSRCRRVWLFWDRTPWIGSVRGATEAAVKALEQTYTKAEERRFFELQVGLYVTR